MSEKNAVTLSEDEFDVFTDPKTKETSSVRKFTWTNCNNVSIAVLSYGATIQSIKLPSTSGAVDDIVMGFDNMKGWYNIIIHFAAHLLIFSII